MWLKKFIFCTILKFNAATIVAGIAINLLCLVGEINGSGKMISDDRLEQQIVSFLKYLGNYTLKNYFTCYSYAYPIFE